MHLGPRHVVRLEMIGVQLDQARQQKIAGQILALILALPRRTPLADLDDEPVHDSDPAALDHAIGENDTGIRQDDAGGAHDTL